MAKDKQNPIIECRDVHKLFYEFDVLRGINI